MSAVKQKWVKLFPYLAFIALFTLLAWLIYTVMNWAGDQSPSKKKSIQEITIIAPPPPPPPPLEQEPPPEVEEVEIEEPEPTPEDLPDLPADEAPPGEQLGLDSDGTGAGDAFGLGGKKGGRGLLSGGDPYAWYSSSVQALMIEKLNEEHEIRRASYSIEVHFWISNTGKVNRFELIRPSGNESLDKRIKKALQEIKQFEAPVPGMAQPVKIKLTARL